MKRFILITGIGAVALLGSHVSLSLGLHPDQLSSFGVLAQGCIVLVLGTSLFASGILGLAENYEKTASRLILVKALKIVLHNGLKILGINAPERM